MLPGRYHTSAGASGSERCLPKLAGHSGAGAREAAQNHKASQPKELQISQSCRNTLLLFVPLCQHLLLPGWLSLAGAPAGQGQRKAFQKGLVPA